MRGQQLTVTVDGGELGGWVTGDGPSVLLVHGGPGLSFEVMDGLADELGDGYRVASYQQRGLAPSMTEGPYDVATHLADVRAVLDALGWDQTFVVGHSWGGHLALHIALDIPQRLSGVVDAEGKPKYPGLHALRHFFASWCINRKVEGGLELPLRRCSSGLAIPPSR